MTTIDEKINKQYSPRFWSKRMPEHVILANHMALINSVSETIRAEIPFIRDVRYGEKATQLMDIYGTDLPKDAPIMVYIHGGYWQVFTKNENNYISMNLWKHKIKTYVPEYDLSPKVSMEEMLDDIKTMAAYVLKEGVQNNVRSIWFCGHSAGGHLSATLLEENWLATLPEKCRQIFKGIVLLSGLYDLLPILQTEQNLVLKLNRSRAIALSPHYNVHHLTQKSLLNDDFVILGVTGENDSPEFIKQSYTYYEKLKEIYKGARYRHMKGLDHFNIAECLIEEDYPILREIISLVKGNGFLYEEQEINTQNIKNIIS